VPLHFRTELVSFEQDADGVNAVVRHRDSGQVTNVRAKYLVGCDGSKSVVREQLGAAFEGEGPLGEFLNVLFDADLSALVEGRRSVGYMIDGTGEGGVRGSFLAVDNRQRWLFNFQIEAGSAGTYDDARLRSVLRSAIGAEVPLNIVSAVTWSPSARVADRYRVGRVLLAGDAAHVVPPNGATGMNCGVQDAHNLWWKLAGVVHGTSPAALLDTYELERRPIALRTAAWALAGHHAAAAGPPPQAPPPGSGGGESGRRAPMSPIGLTLSYRYDEGAFVDADEDAPAPFDDNVYRSTGRPGERTPHLMLQSIHGRHAVSEFVGPGWGLFGGPESGPWSGAIPFTPLFVIGPEMDPEGAFMERFGVGPDGVVLVRPDNVVAWRSRSWVPDGHERLQAAHRQSRGW
jgi:putative polyketide hydroxylase